MKRYTLGVPLMLLLLHGPGAIAQRVAEPPAALGGTLTGIITDPNTQLPLAHVLVTVGYRTLGYQRAAETDSNGRYVVTGLSATPAREIDTYAFAEGYFYHHGRNQVIAAGKTTTYSYGIPRDTFLVKHPQVTAFFAKRINSSLARFGMVALEGTGPFSLEMLAISPQLGYLVVLQHGSGNHYAGTLQVPRGTKPGVYRFYFVATQNDCFTNRKFPSIAVQLG